MGIARYVVVGSLLVMSVTPLAWATSSPAPTADPLATYLDRAQRAHAGVFVGVSHSDFDTLRDLADWGRRQQSSLGDPITLYTELVYSSEQRLLDDWQRKPHDFAALTALRSWLAQYWSPVWLEPLSWLRDAGFRIRGIDRAHSDAGGMRRLADSTPHWARAISGDVERLGWYVVVGGREHGIGPRANDEGAASLTEWLRIPSLIVYVEGEIMGTEREAMLAGYGRGVTSLPAAHPFCSTVQGPSLEVSLWLRAASTRR